MKFQHIRRTSDFLRSTLVFAAVLAATIGCASRLDADDKLTKSNQEVGAMTKAISVKREYAARMVKFRDWPDEDISRTAVPTLVVVGDKDIVLPEHALKMTQLLPQGRLMVVPGTHGEFLGDVMTTRPDSQVPAAVVKVIEEFLDQ